MSNSRLRGLLAVLGGGIALGAILAVLVRGHSAPLNRADSNSSRQKAHWDAVRRGQRLLDSGRPDLAFEAVMDIRDQGPGTAEAMAIAGIALFRLGDPIGARQALELALNLQPNQPDAAGALATLCLGLGDTTRGLAALKLAASAAPDDARPWMDMGRVHLDLGEFDEAVRAFEEALKRNPQSDDIRLGLILGLLNGNRPEAATSRVKEALVRKPRDAGVLGLASRHALALGQHDRSLELADQALQIDPDADEALMARGRLHHILGHSEQALADIERFLELRPNNLPALQLLGQIEARLGLTERAARTAERHQAAYDRADQMARLTEQIAEQPNDPEPRWQMGLLALEGGSTALARRCFEAALQLDPACQPARDSLATLDRDHPGPLGRNLPTALSTP